MPRFRLRAIGVRVLAVLTAALGASLMTSALMVEQGCSEKPAKSDAPTPIVIGVSLGLTKDLQSFAAPLRDAVRAAEGQINAGGGLLGRPVRFEVVDDESNEGEIVVRRANELLQKGAVAIIGPVGSQQVVLTHQIFADKQVIQISPSATSTDLGNIQDPNNRFLFRTTPDDSFQGAAVISFAKKTPNGLVDAGPLPDGGTTSCKRLAVVNIDNAYGNAMADVIQKNFRNDDPTREIIGPIKVETTQKSSYESEVSQIIAQTPQCLALISYEKVAAAFVREFRASPGYKSLDPGFFFIGTDGVFTPGFLELSSENKSDPRSKSELEDGRFYGTNPDTNPATREYNEFKTIFSSYFPLKGADAPAFTANTFDAAVLIAFAIQKAGRLDNPVLIRDSLREVANAPGRPFSPAEIAEALIELREGGDIDYKGASGNVDFEANGNVKSGFIVWNAFRSPDSGAVEYRTVGRFTSDELGLQLK